MGDFEEVERLQAGIRDWLLRRARSGRHELRDVPAQAVLPLLCAAAFGPALTDASDLTSAGAVARIGVLSSVGDGSLVATVGRDGKARLRDAATQQEIGDPMTVGGLAADPQALAFSPNGKILATVAASGAASLWSVATQRQIGAPMTAGPGAAAGGQPAAGPPRPRAAAFNPGGTMLATASGNGTVQAWNVTFPTALTAAACAIADQSLSRQQWSDYAGIQPFQQVCPAS